MEFLFFSDIFPFTSCGNLGTNMPDNTADSYHCQPASSPIGWLIFLPGTSGLSILCDEHHYFSVAERLNELAAVDAEQRLVTLRVRFK